MSFTGEINQKLAGNFNHTTKTYNKLKLLSLTANQALVTDANKFLTSLSYTSLNTVSTLVQRDGSGNFSAGTITASLTGHASLDLLASNNLSDITSASTARSNLGLVIGTNVEAWNATLDAVAAGTYTGSTSITTLGTISTGTWSGTAIGVTHGGTGLTSTTANQILYSSATNTIGGITVVNSAGLLTNGSGVPAWVAYTGSGAPVLATSPSLITPILGTPTSGTLTNCTGLPISTGVSGLGTGIATFLATPSSANLLSAMTTSTGSGNLVFATNPVLVTPNIGTPSAGTLTNCTGLPISTGVSGLGTGIATFLATPSSANLLSAMTTSTGTGNLVFATSPTLVTPLLGTPTSGVLTNCTGLPLTTGVTGILPVANGGSGTATPALVQGTNISITGSWPNQTVNVVNNPTFSGLVTASVGLTANAYSVINGSSGQADIFDITSTGSTNNTVYQRWISGGIERLSLGWDSINGIGIFDRNNAGVVWLKQGGTTAGSVVSKNNTLDDGSGNQTINGQISISKNGPIVLSGVSTSVTNSNEVSLILSNSNTASSGLILRWDGGNGIAIQNQSFQNWIYQGGTSNLSVKTSHNTLDDGSTGAASFAGPVTLPGNATSGLQAVPLQQLTNNGPSVNIVQHTYCGGF